MNISHLKIYIAYTFLAIFLSLKVASLHVITHDDHNEIEHCEYCNLVTTSNLTPLINDNSNEYLNGIWDFNFRASVESVYNYTYCASTNIDSLFSRPPPIFI